MHPEQHNKQVEASYQRGLLLGFTMAEVIMLVVFVLLLALSAMLIKKEKEIAACKNEVSTCESDLQECKTILGSTLEEWKLCKEFQNNLVKCEKKIETLENELILCEKSNEKKDEDLNLCKKELDNLKYPSQTEQELQKCNEELAETKKQLEAANKPQDNLAQIATVLEIDPTSTPDQIVEKIEELKSTLANLRGQNKILLDRLKSSGKGTEKPSCWATESGGIEYIFDIQLTSSGVIVKNNALPHRAEEQAKLPTQNIQYGRTLSSRDFRSQTRPVLDWSNANDCRFFVRVYDKTGAAQKTLYKQMLRTVGESFYYFEAY